jgi:toxin FitB
VFLLDTNIISLVAPSRRVGAAEQRLADWLIASTDSLFLSVVTAAEIEDGIAKAARGGATRKAANLAEWWGEIRHYWHDRILPIDLDTAIETGRLMDKARAAGIAPGLEDLAIAATGSVRSLTILTVNEKDFGPLGVDYLNPIKVQPR